MSEKTIENVANLENYEMLKALYDFQAVYPKTISFEEGEYFIMYQTSAKQRNWWQVVSMKGNIGFVPSNYVMKLKVEPRFLVGFLDSSIESLKQCTDSDINGIISKQELLDRLKEKKDCIENAIELHETNKFHAQNDKAHGNCHVQSSIFKKFEITKKSMSSPAVGAAVPPQMIQESPSMGILSTKLNDVAQDNSMTSETTSETTTTATTTGEDVVTIYKEEVVVSPSNCYEDRAQESINEDIEQEVIDDVDDETQADVDNRDENISAKSNDNITTTCNEVAVETTDVYQIVDIIRRNTNLSFELSCEALRVVVSGFEQLFPSRISPYLEAVAIHVADKLDIPKELLGVTHDAKRLQYIFSQLADCKNDSEQRTWMLYEDEEDIIQFLEELVDILKNADEKISCHEMSCDQYQSLINLVQYYQMETRWPIKRLLLKAFTAACHLDHIIVDILLTSVLPLEIVEDMKTNSSNLEKFKELSKMIIIIFSLGLPMPVNHQEHLNVNFITFIFDAIEDDRNPETLVDLLITLALAFNLQFTDFTQNIIIEALQKMPSLKIFTEKILLLLNREEDPVKILKHSANNINSVLKMFVDLFSLPETAGLFYTNDNKVLIDILVRQLSDLCAGDPMRRYYLELCRRILRNTNYGEHTHRKQDLMKIFTRIFCEETECSASDQQLVRDIANEFPQIFKA